MNKRFLFVCATLFALCTALLPAADRYAEIYIPNGLAHAVVGDWVKIRLPDGSTQKHSVLSKTGEGATAKIVMRIETYRDDKLTGTKNEMMTVGEEFVKPPVPAGKEHVYERHNEVIAFDGSDLEVDIIKVFQDDALLRTWYLATELPVYGVAKRVRADGVAEFEVVDFAFAEAKAE